MNKARRCADEEQLSFYVESLIANACQAVADDKVSVNKPNTISVYTVEDLAQFQEFWSDATGEGAANVKRVLARLDNLGPNWTASPVPVDAALVDLERRFPNFSEPIQLVRRAAALAKWTGSGSLALPPMLLDGAPGIGKSAFARELATVLGVPMAPFSMAQATSSFGLGGLNAQFASGGPGYLVRTLSTLGVPDALIVIDEIDKASVGADYDPTRPLYELLEPTTASRFVDDGLRMPLNLSALRWVATCNDAALIAPPLRSRFQRFVVPAPTKQQLRTIAKNMYRKLVQSEGWSAVFCLELEEDVLQRLSSEVPRDLNRCLRDALGAAALDGRSWLRADDLAIDSSIAAHQMGFLN